jgi:leader peptidase (prepilin peptidase)/N-methyltransferase
VISIGLAGAWLGFVTIFAVIELAALSAFGADAVIGCLRKRPLKATEFLPPPRAVPCPAIWIGWLAEALINRVSSFS